MSAHVDEVSETLSALNDTLWTLRELLGLTEFGLVVQRLVAEAGESRHLTTAADQLDVVCARIQQVEVVRAGLVDAAAVVLGCADDVSLTALAEAAPEPWRMILEDHAGALRGLARSVATHRHATERVLRAGADAVDNALRTLSETAASHGDDPRDFVTSGSRLDRRA